MILSIYLINETSGAIQTNQTESQVIEKFTIGFKTSSKGNIHRHVVLGVYFNGYFGALGISRRSDLGYKILKYKTLTELITEYIECYATYVILILLKSVSLIIYNIRFNLSSYIK